MSNVWQGMILIFRHLMVFKSHSENIIADHLSSASKRE